MGTISDKLMRIINTKEDIRQALISKGYHIPTSIPFKEYAKMILDLPCKVDDFPKLPGDVTRWHFGGLTNEMMAAMDDPRIEDADGKGRFLSFKNFAWKEGSGISDVYPGFILGDGVDDFAVTEKELNFEDTYTVYTAFIPLQNDPIKNMIVCGKDYKKDFYINYGTQLVFYTANSTKSIPLHINQFTVLLCKRDKTTGVIKNLVTGESFQFSVSQLISNPGLYYLWRSATVFSYGKTAIAGQTICNGYFSTDEDDEKVLDWYKKQYHWLFPDQAWTVTGKTNEDGDRATIANITGNGNNLVLSNFGFIEGSGYNKEGEYAGYLVTDGVDDKIDSSAFKMGEDFTVVGEWKLLPVSSLSYSGMLKNDNLYLYNNASTGLRVYIRSTDARNDMEGLKSLKAICSDGRVYGEDWTEYKLSIGSTIGSQSRLYLGYNNTAYTKMIFKNLGIYNNQILSKEDCIKAYNYLQTLKSK